MAIKIGGTEVINNSRELQNISGIDAGSITNLVSAGLGTPTPFVTETGTFTTNQFNFDTGNYFEKTVTSNATFTFNESLTSGDAYEAKVKLAVPTDAQNSGLFADLSTDGIAAMNVTGSRIGNNGGVYGLLTNHYLYGLAFNDDGYRLTVMTGYYDQIFTYALSTAYDISTIYKHPMHVLDLRLLGLPSSFNPQSIKYANSGNLLLISDASGNDVHAIDLSTAYDLSTATYTTDTFVSVNESTTSNLGGVYMSPDGTKLFVADKSTSYAIWRYDLSTAYDVTTATYTSGQQYQWSSSVTEQAQDIDFKPDGTKFYLTGFLTNQIQQFSLSTAWDLTTASYDGASSALSMTNPYSLTFNDDGTKVITSNANVQLASLSLSTPYDVTGASDSVDVATFGVSYTDSDNVRDVVFANNDTKMYVITWANETIVAQFDVTDGNLATRRYTGSYDATSSGAARGEGLALSSDGTKMYIMDNTDNLIYEYDLSTAYDVTTATYNSVSFSYSSQTINETSFEFSSDGTKFYIGETTSDRIYQYSLTTAWDISTASYDSKFLSVNAKETTPYAIMFNSDGTKLFVGGSNSDNVHEYALSTAWDVSTGTFSNTLDFASTSWESDYYIDANGAIIGGTLSSDSGKMYLLKTSLAQGTQPLHYTLLEFTFGDADPVITWPSSVTWYSGSAPSIARGDTALLSLSTNDGGTTWYGNEESPAAAAQTYSYISSATADNSASLTFTLPSGYDGFEFVMSEVLPATATADLYFKVGTSNHLFYMRYEAGTTSSTGSSSGAKLSQSPGNNTSATPPQIGITGVLRLDGNYDDSTLTTTGSVVNQHQSSSQIYFRGVFSTSTKAAETSATFSFSSGNITSGTVKMFGIKSS